MMRAQRGQETIAVQVFVEVVPVQGAQGRLIVAVAQLPGRQEMQRAVAWELPAQRDDIIVEPTDMLIDHCADRARAAFLDASAR